MNPEELRELMTNNPPDTPPLPSVEDLDITALIRESGAIGCKLKYIPQEELTDEDGYAPEEFSSVDVNDL